MKFLIAITSLLFLTSCAKVANSVSEFYPSRSIKCYSGGTLIYEGESKGRLDIGANLSFTDIEDKSRIIKADCVVTDL